MNIEQYNQLRKIRDIFKLVTQLSYNISIIDKRFPLEKLSIEEFNSILKVYRDFYKEYQAIGDKLLSIFEETNGTITSD